MQTKPTLPTPPERIRLSRWERRLPHHYVLAATPDARSLDVDIEIKTTDTNLKRSTKALIDSGATGLFIDEEYVHTNGITTRPLQQQIPVYNVDGTPNEAGSISQVADLVLRYDSHSERALFAVTRLGKQNIILGFTWLRDHNPEIDWQTKEVKMTRCPPRCNTCRLDTKAKQRANRMVADHIAKCRAGAFPTLAEDDGDGDEPLRPNCRATVEDEEDEGDPYLGARPFSSDLPADDEDVEIEEGDRIFVVNIHPSDEVHHSLHAVSTVSQRLAEAHSKNSNSSSFRD
jgi:hypothetical protein